jgi:uracil-DNA glycosylase
MQRQGQARRPSNPQGVPKTDDEIREKYLERAIRELNAFARRLTDCPHCPRGQLMPVLGSGHPQADVFMVKHSARPSEVEEGVAFYGRTGNALMKSLKRLSIDPLAVYGTLCVKCPVTDPAMADPACVGRLTEESS